ncbi:MAG: hypothetical protein OHK0052_12910 [Anaerolineales bacterium]
MSEKTRRLLDFATLAALTAFAASLVLAAFALRWENDFHHLWAAARTLHLGGDPYRALLPIPNQTLVNTQSVAPPWVTVALLPLAALPFESALWIWTLLNAMLLLLSLWLLFQLNRCLPIWGRALLGIGFVWLAVYPFQVAHLDLWLSTALLAALWFWQRQQFALSGISVLALLFKPWVTLGALLGLFVLALARRRWSFIIAFFGGFALMLALTFAGWHGWLYSIFNVNVRQIYGDERFYWAVATWYDLLRITLGVSLTPLMWIVGYIIIGLLCFALLWLAWRRWRVDAIGDATWVAVCLLVFLLLVPYVRLYDLVLLQIWLAAFLGSDEFLAQTPRLRWGFALSVGLVCLLNLAHPLESTYYLLPLGFAILTLLFLRLLPTAS